MLIRVESYAAGEEVTQTIHACLATSQGKDDKSILFSLGRKAGDLTFSSDKTVSRQHCVLRCVGQKEGCLTPRNDKEIEACDRSDTGMCLVLENIGKAGTFVAVADLKTKGDDEEDEDSATDADGNDEDEETDEEGISQPPTSRSQTSAVTNADDTVLSTATKSFWGNKKAKLLKIDVGENQILNFDKKTKTIVVQCGKFESTLKITWMPLRFSFSRLPGNSKLPSKLYLTGGTQEQMPGPNSSYLITPKCIEGAKQMIAWCLSIPILPPEFLEALLNRKSPSEPLPSPEDFELTKTEETFWNQQPNPKLLSHYTLLSVESGDGEHLAIAAGANLVTLNEGGASEATAVERAKEVLKSGGEDLCCFTISSRKKLTKRLNAMGVPSVSIKKIALAISKQQAELQDSNGKPVGGFGATEQEQEKVTSENIDDDANSRPSRKSPRKRKENSTKIQASKRSRLAMVEDTTETESHQETQCLLPSLSEAHEPSLPPEDAQEDEGQFPAPSNEEEEKEPDDESQEVVAPTKKRPLATSDENSTAAKRSRKSISQLAGAGSDGWFTTAPKEDEKRKEWRKRASQENAGENGGIQFLPTAQTQTIALVTPPPAHAKSSNSSRTKTSRRQGGPDFKSFRKNSILTSRATISLRVVLPAESDHQRQMADDQRELEAQQRRADELFRGDGMKKGAARKRRRV